MENRRFDGPTCSILFRQVVDAVELIHTQGFAHRDLKMTNILLNEENEIKLIDFGFACDGFKEKSLFCGTPSYMAPEILTKEKYNGRLVDIWALGVVLYKMVTGEYPFGSKNFGILWAR